MWRNSAASLSLKLSLHLSTTNPLRYGIVGLHRSAIYSTSASSSSPSTPSDGHGVRVLGSTVGPAAADLGSVTVGLIKHHFKCYWELSKARLSMLVVATSGTGYVLGSGNAIDFAGLCWTCAGTMMVAASANSLNQVFEISNDAKMKRTMRRPLPSGRITLPHAITWASAVGVAGTAILSSKANMMAAGLAASNLILYAFVYTPLKQIHPVNTWVGAVVGAIPPLLGWAAASENISLPAMILPAALYFWQIPHFMALAYLCRDDYAAGGYKMYSLADASGQKTAAVALRNCLYLVPLGYLAYDCGMASGWFCIESTLITLAITASAFSFYRERTMQKARKMFYASLLYLPAFMFGIIVHHQSDNRQCLVEDKDNVRVEHLSSSESVVQMSKDKYQNKARYTVASNHARPPVAYASSAPFPFLPAPCYSDS